jgi:hypothetical protein
VNPGDDIKHYTWLHRTQRYGYCPQDLARATEVWHFLQPQLNPGQAVLDCSAGRGVLLRLLQPYGIECYATEADPFVVAHELQPFRPMLLRYDELAELRPATWDAVVSIDVLEHLYTEDAVRAALRDLAALSAQWLCVSVGLCPSSWTCERGEIVKLHHVVKPGEWWREEVARVAEIVRAYTFHASEMIFAEVER